MNDSEVDTIVKLALIHLHSEEMFFKKCRENIKKFTSQEVIRVLIITECVLKIFIKKLFQ